MGVGSLQIGMEDTMCNDSWFTSGEVIIHSGIPAASY